MRILRWTAGLALVALLVPAAVAAEEVDLQNATCPVKGNAAKATVTESYKGMKVHFCCVGCAAKFKLDPEPYIPKLRADPAVAKRMDAALTSSGATPAAPAGELNLEGWGEPAKAVAVKVHEKHGAPKTTEAATLVWEEQGSWKRIVVHKDGAPLEHVVAYKVDGMNELPKFKEHAVYDSSKGELSARHDREELNVLALNLANEIATGKKTVDQAKTAWGEHEKALKEGKSSEYTTSLMFEPAAKEETK